MAINNHNCNHLLIGLGGTGGKILKAFKKKLYEEFPNGELLQKMNAAVAFLYVDSTDDMIRDYRDPSWMVNGQNVAFCMSEFLNIRPYAESLAQILDNVANYPGLKYVVTDANAMRNALGFVTVATGQKRRAGRILFASCVNMFLNSVHQKRQELAEVTYSDSLHVHIFTGLAGGTGSGSIVDVIVQIRKAYPDAIIDVYAMIPGMNIPVNHDAGRYHANVYAALHELSALNIGQFLPSDVVTGEEYIKLKIPNFGKHFALRLFSNVDDDGNTVRSAEEVYKMVAESVFNYVLSHENENSLIQFERLFSVSALECLPKFKEKYDALVNDADEYERTKNCILLHVEGDGQDLLSLDD